LDVSIEIITASAGSGKTTRLSKILDEALADGALEPSGVVATTFTREAAATLIERARGKLLAGGHGRQAHQLLAARIGTVNAVCGALVAEFAFELGLSPALRVLDEQGAALEQRRALAAITSEAVAEELAGFKARLQLAFDWQADVAAILDAARVNRLGPDELRACAARSIASLDRCLGPVADGDLDAAVGREIDRCLATLDLATDTTDKTADFVAAARAVRADLGTGLTKWGNWAKLCKEPGKKSAARTAALRDLAATHRGHPRLRADLHRLIDLLFTIAADGLKAYEDHKRERGLLDFVDQEALALTLLERADVRDALAGQLDLVLVDEFQDTSPLQLAIFLALAGLAARSVWVGDQKQAIYGFRGTDPALMDAAIESLTGTATDPELLRRAVDALDALAATPAHRPVETLPISYRSRPGLVAVTSALFAEAFSRQGIPAARSHLEPALKVEPPGLGSFVEHWSLVGKNAAHYAAATATGVRALLAEDTMVRDRDDRPRRATAADVAVLCRTNAQCQAVADALAALGVAAVLPRMGVLATPEGRLLRAALELWLDPRDAVAAATLARLTSHAADLVGLVARVVATPGAAAFTDEPVVAAVLAARAAAPDLDPLAVVDAVLAATALRTRLAAWGGVAQRRANLDALRGHAAAYVTDAEASRRAPTLLGLLGRLAELTAGDGSGPPWARSSRDAQAVPAGGDAVTISTWHRAKGREWPVTILFGLESTRTPTPTGLHVETEGAFELAAPLAGRWLRYWPDPYTTSNQGGPVREAFAASVERATAEERATREILRLLYVGWTRARDRLVLAAATGKLYGGLLAPLEDALPLPDPADGVHTVRWAGRDVEVRARTLVAAPAVDATPTAGEALAPRAAVLHPPARTSPSAAAAVPCTLGAPQVLGARLHLRRPPGVPDGDAMEHLGRAVHAFFAADHDDLDDDARRALAGGLIDRHGVSGRVAPEDVVAAATRLWIWSRTVVGATHLYREWPLAAPQPNGTLVSGTADLVLRTPAGLIVVDHKTFPGELDVALTRLPKYAGQLAAYAAAIAAATGTPVIGTWIHLPILGVMVEVRAIVTP
jgi:ATP-dependent exoDNAse (exonuclease V) beta subunit